MDTHLRRALPRVSCGHWGGRPACGPGWWSLLGWEAAGEGCGGPVPRLWPLQTAQLWPSKKAGSVSVAPGNAAGLRPQSGRRSGQRGLRLVTRLRKAVIG